MGKGDMQNLFAKKLLPHAPAVFFKCKPHGVCTLKCKCQFILNNVRIEPDVGNDHQWLSNGKKRVEDLVRSSEEDGNSGAWSCNCSLKLSVEEKGKLGGKCAVMCKYAMYTCMLWQELSTALMSALR